MGKLKATWYLEPQQELEALHHISYKPYFSWLHDKLHDWAYKSDHWFYNIFGWKPNFHDWLAGQNWYRTWGRRKDVFDDACIRKLTDEMAKEIDNLIIEKIVNEEA